MPESVVFAQSRLLDEVYVEDHATVMAVVARAVSRGTGYAPVRRHADAVPTALHAVSLVPEHGVLLMVLGGRARPLGEDPTAQVEPPAPRRLVHHRDVRGTSLAIDDATERLLGWTHEQMHGVVVAEFIDPRDRGRAIEGWLAMLAGHPQERKRIRYLTADGGSRWMEVSQRNLLDDPDHGYVEVELIDVHDEMVARDHARAGDLQFETLTESLPVGVVQVDRTTQVVYANQRMRDLCGAPGADIARGTGVHPEDRDAVTQAFRQAIVAGEVKDLDVRLADHSGEGHRFCRVRVRPLGSDDDGNTRGAIASVEDLTETIDLQHRLQQRLHTDVLTGLPNRSALTKWLDDHPYRRAGDPGVTLFFIDLDGFKKVNDSLGHDAGDRFLQEIAGRIARVLTPVDILARIGGDEFVAACSSALSHDEIVSLTTRALGVFEEPIVVAGHGARVGCSIGVARSSAKLSPAELLANADMAMYEAKNAGGHRWAMYERTFRTALESQFHLENELREALDSGDLRLHLQPVLDLETGLTVGAEALIRWYHPERGVIAPGDFIPMAERSTLMVPLGRWVMDDACRLARRVADEFAAPCQMSVNLSGRSLAVRGFHGEIMDQVRGQGVSPASLMLEVTETALIDTSEAAVLSLAQLARAGFTIALDDFGTGFSSLNHLRSMPNDVIKIDRSYTACLDTDGDTSAIVRAVVGLSRDLGRQVIAEGIETPEQLNALRSMGIRLGQGYLLGRPMPEDDFFALDRTAIPVRFLAAADLTDLI